MRIAMLGCGGFIGSHLLEALLENESIEIEGWDFDSNKITHLLGASRFQFHQGDFLNQGALPRINEFDVIISLAAICNPAQYNTNPLNTIESNFIQAIPVVQACAEQKVWLIHFSTSEVYGRTLASYSNSYGNKLRTKPH